MGESPWKFESSRPHQTIRQETPISPPGDLCPENRAVLRGFAGQQDHGDARDTFRPQQFSRKNAGFSVPENPASPLFCWIDRLLRQPCHPRGSRRMLPATAAPVRPCQSRAIAARTGGPWRTRSLHVFSRCGHWAQWEHCRQLQRTGGGFPAALPGRAKGRGPIRPPSPCAAPGQPWPSAPLPRRRAPARRASSSAAPPRRRRASARSTSRPVRRSRRPARSGC